ncbi:MAG: glycerophosphodiester phosphodiesterase [Actinomycetota bacterium]
MQNTGDSLKNFRVENLRVVGHRGWPRRFPDNSMAGIAAAAGVADMVEVDVRRTADGVLVLSHEPEIGGLPVSGWEWSRLREVDLGGGNSPVAVVDLLAGFAAYPFNLEVKNFPGEPGFDPDHRVAVETAQHARSPDLLSCFFWPSMDAVRSATPEVETGLLVDEGWSVDDAVDHALSAGHRAIVPHWRLALAEPQAIGRAVASGLTVAVWTLNDPDRLPELESLGVTVIITDDPGMMRQAIGATK